MARRVPLVDIGNTYGSQFAQRDSKPKARSPRADDDRKHNQLNVVQYVAEIMENLRLTEVKFMPSPTYMSRQTDINEKMRAILVDWLVDVHLKFKLVPETQYLSISLIDRFLDQKVVTRSKLQLVGVVAMLAASKYEEIYPPEIQDFIYISANTYTKDDIIKMERLMLNTLEFGLTSPTIYPFLRRALQVAEADQTCQHMALYISELAMLEYKMLHFLPSIIAAGCVYLARKILQHLDPWNWILEYYTTHTMMGLQTVAQQLYELVKAAPQHRCQAIHKKYSFPKFSSVSELAEIPVYFP